MQESRTSQAAIAAAEGSRVVSARFSSSGRRGPACAPGAGPAAAGVDAQGCAGITRATAAGQRRPSRPDAVPLAAGELGPSEEPRLLQTRPAGVNAAAAPAPPAEGQAPLGAFHLG